MTSKPQARAQSTSLADQRRLVAVGERVHDARPRWARSASSGPASASASTLTMTMCLPRSQQASTCSMPAAGEPGGIDDDVDVGFVDHASRIVEVAQRRDRRFGPADVRAARRAHAAGRDRQSPRRARPACGAPGTGTSIRTCRRRSGRRAAARRAPRAASAVDEGSPRPTSPPVIRASPVRSARARLAALDAVRPAHDPTNWKNTSPSRTMFSCERARSAIASLPSRRLATSRCGSALRAASAGVGRALRGQLALQFPGAQPAALAKPQRILDRHQQDGQHDAEYPHRSAQVVDRRRARDSSRCRRGPLRCAATGCTWRCGPSGSSSRS